MPAEQKYSISSFTYRDAECEIKRYYFNASYEITSRRNLSVKFVGDLKLPVAIFL